MCKTSASRRNLTPQLIRLAQSSKSNSAVKANPPKISQIDALIIFSIEKSGFITVQSLVFCVALFTSKMSWSCCKPAFCIKKSELQIANSGWRIHDDPSKCVNKNTTFRHIKPAFKQSQNPPSFAHCWYPPSNDIAFKPLRPRGESLSGKLCLWLKDGI